MTKIGEILFPGDTIQELNYHNGALILGPGLRRHPDQDKAVIVTRSGFFCHRSPNVYWIESQQKRYVPKKGDVVVGIVTAKRGDLLKVDIGSSELASLLLSAFEGATKKRKPNVNIGDVIYARLLSATREMEPELVCVDSYFKAGRLGILSNEGFVFTINQNFAHRLLNYDNALLRSLGKKMMYEIAIGANGKVWLKGRNPKELDVVYRAINAAERQSDNDIQMICRR